MNFAIPFGNFGSGVPATGVVADIPLWTPATYFALAIQIVWILGALALLLSLTVPRGAEQSTPRQPIRRRADSRDDGPPLAA
jgi:hypothetical protein